MKKIKLELTVEQQQGLGDMFMEFILTDEMKETFPLEYYVLAEWFGKQASRFLILTEKRFLLSWSEACALHRLLKFLKLPPAWANVATGVLWQIDRLFASSPRPPLQIGEGRLGNADNAENADFGGFLGVETLRATSVRGTVGTVGTFGAIGTIGH